MSTQTQTITVKEINLEGQKKYDDLVYPCALGTEAEAKPEDGTEWVRKNVSLINEKLDKHGAVVFRGFGWKNAEDFYEFLKCFPDWEYGTYIGGGGPRKKIIGPIQTSTESPPEFFIPFHHELAYLPTNPARLCFFCEIPAKARGETPIVLSSKVYEQILKTNPKFVEKLKEKGVRYLRVIADEKNCNNDYQKPWQDIYQAKTREEAEKNAKASGTDVVEWLEDGSMKVISQVFPGVELEPRTKTTTWFNSIVLLHPSAHPDEIAKTAPWKPMYGDYSTIEDEDIKKTVEIFNAETVKFKWQTGDIMIVDNKLSMHARSSFEPPRRILAAMCTK